MGFDSIGVMDLVIVVGYLLGITAIGIYVGRRQTESSSGYFLAGRSLSWVTVGLALFATNISTIHLIGLASAGYGDGMVVGNFEWMAPSCLILLGLVFAPFYFRTKISTLPEFLEGRFSPGSRTCLAVMAVLGALFIHIGISLYAGAVMFKEFVDIHIYWSILIVSALTVIYTILGGLKAVVVTESIQTILLLLGAFAVTLYAINALGEKDIDSLSDLHRAALERQVKDAEGLAAVTREAETLFPRLDALQKEGKREEAGALLGAWAEKVSAGFAVGAVSSALKEKMPSVDGAIVKSVEWARTDSGKRAKKAPFPSEEVAFSPALAKMKKLAAGGEKDAGALQKKKEGGERSSKLKMIRTDGGFAWYYILLGYPILGIWYWCSDQTIVQRVLGAKSERDAQIGPIFASFIKVLPVLIMVLPGVMGYVLFREAIGENADATLIVLIKKLLPAGLKGVVIAGLLAALMSTVAGALNSVGTLVSIDIVKRLRPDTRDRTLVFVGQITAVVVMAFAILWSMQGEHFGGIFNAINQIISVLAPPITAVFMLGIFWKRGTAQASLATLIFGFVLGMVVFVLDFPVFGYEIITKDLGMPFMGQAFILCMICCAFFVTVSLMTPAPDPEKVSKYCWGNPIRVITEKPLSGASDPRILTAILLVVMVVCYLIFA